MDTVSDVVKLFFIGGVSFEIKKNSISDVRSLFYMPLYAWNCLYFNQSMSAV